MADDKYEREANNIFWIVLVIFGCITLGLVNGCIQPSHWLPPGERTCVNRYSDTC